MQMQDEDIDQAWATSKYQHKPLAQNDDGGLHAYLILVMGLYCIVTAALLIDSEVLEPFSPDPDGDADLDNWTEGFEMEVSNSLSQRCTPLCCQ